MRLNGCPATIRSGIFIIPFDDPAKPAAQCYDEVLELIVRAEELGFNEFWIREHHTMKYEKFVMPEIFIARALGETKTIRLGPAPAASSSTTPPMSLAAWRSSTTCPSGGSTFASAPAASRPTRNCTTSSPGTPPNG